MSLNQRVDVVADCVGAVRELLEQLGLGLARHAHVLLDGQVGGDVGSIGVHGRQNLLVGHVNHRESLDVDEVRILLELDLVVALGLDAAHDAELLEQGDVLLLHHRRRSIGQRAQVGQAALGGLLSPLGAVAVAVEDDVLVVGQGLLDPGHGVGLKARAALHGVGEILELLGNGRVEHHVGVGQVLARTSGAELELVAREGEGRGAVAVGGVLGKVGQHRHAQVHALLVVALVGLALDDGLDDAVELVAQEDGDDCGRCLVGAQTVVVTGRGNADAQHLLVIVHSGDDAGEEDEELQVLLGGVAGIEQVLAVGRQRPVVMLARAVDALERLLVLQAHQAVVAGDDLHELHDEQVVVDGDVGLLEHGSKLVLAGGDLVVLGLCRHGELPQLGVKLLHEAADGGADGAEVVLLELLALVRGGAEEGAAAQDEVGALGEVLFLDEEVLLLGADGADDAVGMLAEEGHDALGLVAYGSHGAQKRGLLVERFTVIADERRGDAQDVVLDEGRARGVPGGVAACLERGAQAAGGEARRVGLALDQFLAGEGHDGRAVAAGVQERVVLLARDAGEGLEPVGVVRGALLNGPFLHSMGDDVGHLDVEGLALLKRPHERLVGHLGELLLHDLLAEDLAAEVLAGVVCHLNRLLSMTPRIARTSWTQSSVHVANSRSRMFRSLYGRGKRS